VTNDWSSGYQVDVKVSNTGPSVTDKWTVILDVPANQTLSSVWNANKLSQTGNSYTYGNLSWNGTLQPKASTSFGGTFARTASTTGAVSCRVQSGPVNHAPSADFTTAVTNDTVHIQSVNGVDADGDKLTYSFDFGDGKGINYPDVWHSYEAPGTYTITQTVSDGKTTSVATHQVTVGEAGSNRAPVAVFAYQTTGLTLALNARASADPEANALSYTWDYGNGPSAPASDSQTSINLGQNGTYYVTLTVFDGQLGNTVQYAINASNCTNNSPAPVPVVKRTLTGSTLTIDASESRNVWTFYWDLGDGTHAEGPVVTHTYAAPGNYLVNMSLTGFTKSISEQTTVEIAGATAGLPPVVGDLTCTGYEIIYDDFVNHTGYTAFHAYCDLAGSSDPEGAPLIYTVNWGDGSAETLSGYPRFSHDYRYYNRNVTITVKVSDGTNVSQRQFPFYAGKPVVVNLPPVAALSCKEEPAIEGSGYVTNCDATASSDPEGKPLGYEISWGDSLVESNSTGTFSHRYAENREYQLTLKVTDGWTNTYKSIYWDVRNGDTSNRAPDACFGLGGTGTNTVTVSSCAQDPDGDPISLSWDFGDGTTATGQTASHSYSASGDYTITFTASDGKLSSTGTYVFSYVAPVKTTSCTFKINSQWAGGYNASFVIKNESTTPITNWEALLTFPTNETVSSKFNGTFSGTNPLSVKPPAWATTLQPGASQEVGFLVWKTDASLPAQGPQIGGANCQ
jgi:PKD repeat protein